MVQVAGHIGTVSVPGADLAVRDDGDGEPVVFVHGSVSDMRSWDAAIAVLRARYRTIAYSRRYATPNAPIPPEADDPLPIHADDLAEVISARVDGPAHVVGHSLGGFIALLTGLRHPALVRSLTLIEPPVIPLYLDIPPSVPGVLRLVARAPRAAATIIGFAATTMVPARKAFERGDTEAAIRAFGRGVLGRDRFARMDPARLQIVRDNIATERAQMLGAGYPSLDDSAIRGLSCPVLLVRGAESPAVFGLLLQRLGALLPRSEHITVPGASHIVQEDAPAAFAACLDGFLARH